MMLYIMAEYTWGKLQRVVTLRANIYKAGLSRLNATGLKRNSNTGFVYLRQSVHLYGWVRLVDVDSSLINSY